MWYQWWWYAYECFSITISNTSIVDVYTLILYCISTGGFNDDGDDDYVTSTNATSCLCFYLIKDEQDIQWQW